MAPDSAKAVPHDPLVSDLARLRRSGITKLRSLPLPNLRSVAVDLRGNDDPSTIEDLLRQALNGLGGGAMARAGLVMFGLAQGTRGLKPTELRELASDQFDVLPGTFRKRHEAMILDAVAQQLRGLTTYEQVKTPRRDETPDERRARLEALAVEIGELTAVELGEFLPMLYERLGVAQERGWTSHRQIRSP